MILDYSFLKETLPLGSYSQTSPDFGIMHTLVSFVKILKKCGHRENLRESESQNFKESDHEKCPF